MSVFHYLQTETEGIHQIHNWEYANAAARTGASGFTSDDVHKIALQLDNNSFWLLTAITPTWVAIGSGGAGDHEIEDAVTAAVTDVVTITHNSTGTPANGFGTGIILEAETSTTPDTPVGGISWLWSNATHASRLSRMNMYTYSTSYKQLMGVLQGVAGSSIVDGNARGGGAVEFQLRQATTEVASGGYSTIIGGRQNTASNILSVVLGASHAVASVEAQVVRSGGRLATNGDTQASDFTIRSQITHSGSSWYSVEIGSSGFIHVLIGTDRAWAFSCLLVGATSGLAKVFGFRIEGVIENDGGTTTMLNYSVTTLYNGDDTSFEARAQADNTNDALLIQVRDTDGGGDTVRWSGTIEAAEIYYA